MKDNIQFLDFDRLKPTDEPDYSQRKMISKSNVFLGFNFKSTSIEYNVHNGTYLTLSWSVRLC